MTDTGAKTRFRMSPLLPLWRAAGRTYGWVTDPAVTLRCRYVSQDMTIPHLCKRADILHERYRVDHQLVNTSNTRYESHCAATAELFLNRSHYLHFLQFVRDRKVARVVVHNVY